MTTDQKIIKNKLGLLRLAERLGNVSEACKVMGYSRDSFYRFKELYEQGGEAGLVEISRKKPIVANRVEERIEVAVVAFATDKPAYGQVRVSNELKKEGILISPGGVRSVWKRHNLETFKKRLKGLEVKSAAENYILTEEQLKALEKGREEKEAHGEIETAHPGYLISQDTFFVGTLKGVGRIYQQTVVDTYSKVAFAKLYDGKTALVAADMLNDQVVPFFEDEGLRILRVLTDRGTEYCGNIEHHAYQLYLALEDIDHTRTKVRHPQTNGICERFHRTILEEFYSVAFRKKIYSGIEQLQTDLNEWLRHYNEERTHSGKHCLGRTPMQTFKEAKQLARDKLLDTLFQPVAEAIVLDTHNNNNPVSLLV
jgi:transposase InsO family protein